MYLIHCWIGANGYLLSSDGIWSNNISAKLRKSPSKVHDKTDDLAAYFGLAGITRSGFQQTVVLTVKMIKCSS